MLFSSFKGQTATTPMQQGVDRMYICTYTHVSLRDDVAKRRTNLITGRDDNDADD